ncbi:MAG TPA: cyanophycin synthetase [Kofleriaceae bacterium]|nr:cyanophycin synthetase [Kofleriaceae bacterium]
MAADASAYRDLLTRLLGARRFGMKLGLDRIRALLDQLGAPDRRLGTVVHIAGTNGKGSTVAMLATLVRGCGKRVATYTSPHLSTLRERITIDGQLVSEQAIVEAAARVEAAGGGELTFFEQITAIAMLIIADARVDVTILEVGLGGRLDATNVVDARTAPIAVITGVAMDHEAILGTTLDAIAREKAGIVKRGQRVVIGASGEPAAVPLLRELAFAAGAARVTVVDDSAIARVPPVALPGAHQRANAAAALAALDDLEMAPAPPHDIVELLAHVTHPGRFELVGATTIADIADNRDAVILDGAHNPHGARALAATLRAHRLRPVLVVAVSADKDVRAIADALAPEVSAVIATRYQQERALDPPTLADAFRAAIERMNVHSPNRPQIDFLDDRDATSRASSVRDGRDATSGSSSIRDGRGATSVRVELAADLEAALARARVLGGPILVAGSLFIVGEARVLLLGAPADPIAISDPAKPAT